MICDSEFGEMYWGGWKSWDVMGNGRLGEGVMIARSVGFGEEERSDV